MTPPNVGRCDCCKQIQILTPNGFCLTCDHEIAVDYERAAVLNQEAQQEEDAETPKFD